MPVADVFITHLNLYVCPTPPYPLCSPLSFFSCFLKDKFWYCRLSPNHKVLHYGDLEESPQGEVPHDSLQDKCKCQVKLLIAFANCCDTVSIQICVVGKHAWFRYIADAQLQATVVDADWCHVELVLTSVLLVLHAQ